MCPAVPMMMDFIGLCRCAPNRPRFLSNANFVLRLLLAARRHTGLAALV
jgi:hypothetical protein